MSRKSLSNKLRFEVLKRDGFTCQYCGAKAPDVQLEVDHIYPVKLGGKNELDNLITACRRCNHGKLATPLEDVSYIELHTQKEESVDVDKVIQAAEERYSEIREKAQEHEKKIQYLIDLTIRLCGGWESFLSSEDLSLEEYAKEGTAYFHKEYEKLIRMYGFEEATNKVLRWYGQTEAIP